MTTRSRKWTFVAQEAKRLAGLGMKPKEIAERLEVNKSTVTRWIAAGKLKPGRAAKAKAARGPAPPPRPKMKAGQWATQIRRSYDLNSTDDQLVTLAQAALMLALDAGATPNTRLQGMNTFRSLVKQLGLETRGIPVQKGADQIEGEPPATPKKNPAVRRPKGDPRTLLMMVPPTKAVNE